MVDRNFCVYASFTHGSTLLQLTKVPNLFRLVFELWRWQLFYCYKTNLIKKFTLLQGSKDVYDEHIIYFVLAMSPFVITTISFHNFYFSCNLENELYVSIIKDFFFNETDLLTEDNTVKI